MEPIQQIEKWQRQADEALPGSAADMDVTRRLLKHGAEAIAALRRMESTANFYRLRCELLQEWQDRMREPERTLVCDILANGCTLPDPHGVRYPPSNDGEASASIDGLGALLPCPFCGGKARPTAHLTYSWFAPVCESCGVRGPAVRIERGTDQQKMRELLNQADALWNTRAPNR